MISVNVLKNKLRAHEQQNGRNVEARRMINEAVRRGESSIDMHTAADVWVGLTGGSQEERRQMTETLQRLEKEREEIQHTMKEIRKQLDELEECNVAYQQDSIKPSVARKCSDAIGGGLAAQKEQRDAALQKKRDELEEQSTSLRKKSKDIESQIQEKKENLEKDLEKARDGLRSLGEDDEGACTIM